MHIGWITRRLRTMRLLKRICLAVSGDLGPSCRALGGHGAILRLVHRTGLRLGCEEDQGQAVVPELEILGDNIGREGRTPLDCHLKAIRDWS